MNGSIFYVDTNIIATIYILCHNISLFFKYYLVGTLARLLMVLGEKELIKKNVYLVKKKLIALSRKNM